MAGATGTPIGFAIPTSASAEGARHETSPSINFCIWRGRRRAPGHVAGRYGRRAIRTRPVRMIVGFAAGRRADIVARLIGQWLSERLGQPFVIENRPGAGGNIATEAVVRVRPRTATRSSWYCSANAINATLYDKLSFNFIRDIAPIAGISRVADVMW